MEMLDAALRYAALKWFIFPLHSIRFDSRCGCGREDCQSPGKHPRIKWSTGASCDPEVVRGYWTKWPHAGIGLACGPSGLLVADADGLGAIGELRALLGGAIPKTALSRTARGGHFFYRSTEGRTRSNPETKLDTRGAGGFIVLAPSPHVSGHVYRWEVEPWGEGAVAEAPTELVAYSQGGRKRDVQGGSRGVPGIEGAAPWTVDAVRESTGETSFTTRLGACLVDWHEVDRALASINPDCSMDDWIRVGMALHAAGDDGRRWDRWSSRGTKYREGEPAYKWTTFKQDPDGVGLGSLFVIAQGYGYERPVISPIQGQESVEPAVYMNGHKVLGESVQKLGALPAGFNDAPIKFPDMTEGGKVKATCANAVAALRMMEITCEGDRFHERYRVGGHVMEQWAGELSDAMVQIVRVLIRDRFHFDPGKQHTGDALEQECLCHSYHPIKNYFDSLQWDGIPRLDTWMGRYLGAVDDVFNRQVSRLSLVAAVRRVLQPGCKFDHIIVLEGPEGRGKSTAIEILAGAENFSDQSILTLDDKGQQEAVQGVWLYEIADLAGHSRAEVERVKAFASRTTDRARPAYGRHRVDRPRTCVFFATTNDRTYLKSQTGNRRFWPVLCGLVDLEGMRRDRDQLWAEALAVERSGVSLVLDPKLWGEAAERQESRRDHDPWDDKLEHLHKHACCKTTTTGIHKIWSRDILDAVLQIPITQQGDVVSKRLAYALRRLGWDGPKLVRVGEDVGRGYSKLKTVTSIPPGVTEIDEYVQQGNS